MKIETKTKTGNAVTIENVSGTSRIKATLRHPKVGTISGEGKWGELEGRECFYFQKEIDGKQCNIGLEIDYAEFEPVEKEAQKAKEKERKLAQEAAEAERLEDQRIKKEALAMCPQGCVIARQLWSNGDLCSAEYQDQRGIKALASDLLDHHREWYFVPKKEFEAARKKEIENRAKQKAAQVAEDQRVAAIFVKARETGEKQELHRFPIDCTDPSEECNVDIVTVWAMPDGSKSETKNHTW